VIQYLPRTVDIELDELLPGAPAIALEGPKGVGKTATLIRRARTVYKVDNVLQRALLEADPDRLERDPTPILLDEWQRLPALWDLVRRNVDADPVPGKFLLAGSAVPMEVPVHSGAGRIITLRMRPLSLAERGIAASPTVSLADLLAGKRPPLEITTTVGLPDYVREIVASGFPAIRVAPAHVRRALLDGYLERTLQRDFPEQGHAVRRPAALLAWLRAYAAATATATSYSRILDAATPGEADKPARSTTEAYRSVLSDLWILDPLPAWLPTRNMLQRLAQAPKHQLADPALAARLLGIGADALLQGEEAGPVLLRDGDLLGRLFESLVTLSVRVYAQASEARVYHLRTRNGDHEIDLIIERDDGRVIAIEVKLSPVVTDDDVKHLHWLHEQIGDDLLDAIVITTGKDAYRRADGIGVIPAAGLGA
jgi:predicted AAA+ superfamily ATPase